MGKTEQGIGVAEVLHLNLYVHFPFCRRKCTYCALHSRAGSTKEARANYVRQIAAEVSALSEPLATVYFGGGSPALCDLKPLFDAIRPRLADGYEFTVELHPLDVCRKTLESLKSGGVNRVSMGVQSLDDATLVHMGRGYTFDEADKAFALVKEYFDNAGIDMIIGYPLPCDYSRLNRLVSWGLKHCSVYSLILEERSILAHQINSLTRPSDDEVLDRICAISRFIASIGLRRYEISNYAVPGFECRHNMAVWRGEDYVGLGEGAHGRVGLTRTVSGVAETVTPDVDERERTLFRLRTIDGLDASSHPEWLATLDKFAIEHLLVKDGTTYRLTERGTEVCDSILEELI